MKPPRRSKVFVLIASYLLLVFVLPVALSGVVSYRALPVGRTCPCCRADTLPLLAAKLRLMNRLHPFGAVERRWCLACGWEGLSRQPRRRSAPRPQPAPAAATEAPATQTLDICSLVIDGTPWRVMLQCWHGSDLYYGRFMFVAPTGKLWLGAVESFAAENEREVLGQALALSERNLEKRLRRLVADR